MSLLYMIILWFYHFYSSELDGMNKSLNVEQFFATLGLICLFIYLFILAL